MQSSSKKLKDESANSATNSLFKSQSIPDSKYEQFLLDFYSSEGHESKTLKKEEGDPESFIIKRW